MIFEIVDTSRDGSCVCEKIKIENEWSQLARVKYVQQVQYVDLYLRANIATKNRKD